MSITKARKNEVIQEYQRDESDTGSPEVQIAVLSHRIKALQGHFDKHQKDHSSRRGLLALVGRRRRLLDYLKRTKPESYKEIIKRLAIRK